MCITLITWALFKIYYLKGNRSGTESNVTTMAKSCRGTPTLTKSLNLYSPGPITRVFTGDAIGVANAVEAANATVIR
jgi:hypothetical protein